MKSQLVFWFVLAWGCACITGYTFENDNPVVEAVQEMLSKRLLSKLYRREMDSLDKSDDSWTGRWFPEKPTDSPKIKGINLSMSKKEESMWSMINSTCDDGKTNLTIDWPGSFINYTCFNPNHRYIPESDLAALIIKDSLPSAYHARHVCMNSEIIYDSYLPTFGPHRPAWPRYGEYTFLPRQRWLHSLEHGAVVMLYHPCTHPHIVQQLRDLVESCLYRHVITPYTLLPANRPLALVTWGWALLMSDVDVGIALDFIRNHALRGPEQTATDGQYDYMMIKPSSLVTTINDAIICPKK